jgi:hypothetical protein
MPLPIRNLLLILEFTHSCTTRKKRSVDTRRSKRAADPGLDTPRIEARQNLTCGRLALVKNAEKVGQGPSGTFSCQTQEISKVSLVVIWGHNDTPCGRPAPGRPISRPESGRPQGVIGGF